MSNDDAYLVTVTFIISALTMLALMIAASLDGYIKQLEVRKELDEAGLALMKISYVVSADKYAREEYTRDWDTFYKGVSNE